MEAGLGTPCLFVTDVATAALRRLDPRLGP
jgi:hypothetical protein